jgi:hypothetical protein
MSAGIFVSQERSNPRNFEIRRGQSLPVSSADRRQKLAARNLTGCSSVPVSMNSRILSLPQDNHGPNFAYAKHRRISAGIFHPPVFNDIGGQVKRHSKKCQQNCQQESSRGLRREFSTSSPVLLESSLIRVCPSERLSNGGTGGVKKNNQAKPPIKMVLPEISGL